jgi:hypothetical protein
MHRRHATTAVRALLLLLAGGTFACSVVLVWLAASNPLELEVREGSVWIHVLASRAGVDLYDPLQVSFVNMNHGPLDPILKTWLSRLVPSMAGHWVTRSFVLATPVFFLGSAYLILRRDLASALLAAGALYLFLAHLSLLVLVGRSDATAICFLAVAGLLTHQLLQAPRTGWFERRPVLRQIGLGAISAVVFLTSSRYLPAVAAFQFVVATARVARVRPRHLTSAKSHRTVARLIYALEECDYGVASDNEQRGLGVAKATRGGPQLVARRVGTHRHGDQRVELAESTRRCVVRVGRECCFGAQCQCTE